MNVHVLFVHVPWLSGVYGICTTSAAVECIPEGEARENKFNCMNEEMEKERKTKRESEREREIEKDVIC